MKPAIRTHTAYPTRRTPLAQRLWCPSPGWTPCYAMRAAQARRAAALQPVHPQDCQADGSALATLCALSRSQRYAQNELAQLEAEMAALLKSIGLPPQDMAPWQTPPAKRIKRAKRRKLKGLQMDCQELREELAWIAADLKSAWDQIGTIGPNNGAIQ